MTFRVYVRWPDQRVTKKTTIDSRAVAELAFRELESNAAQLTSQGALGIAYTDNGAQIEYVGLCEERNQKAPVKP
jgi:hypothetical protein